MKVVVDVNVWISALLWGGVPDKVLILAEDKKITIFASEALFLELETTLRRRKFQSKILSLDLNVDDVINATKDVIQMCPDISVDAPQLRDSKDNKILAAAVAANAEVTRFAQIQNSKFKIQNLISGSLNSPAVRTTKSIDKVGALTRRINQFKKRFNLFEL